MTKANLKHIAEGVKMLRRIWLICSLTVTVLLADLLVGCGPSISHSDSVTLQLNWFHATEFIGYYTADAKGYYRNANLNVKINQGGTGISARDYILDGRADFAIASFNEQNNLIKAGKPSIAVMTVFQIPPLVMFALADSGIKEPKDMVGKRIGIKNDYWRGVERETLTNAGISPSQVIEVNVPVDAQKMLYERQVDVWMGYAHDESVSAEVSGHPVKNIYPADYGVGGYEGLLLTNTATISQKANVVGRFVLASRQGLQYALEHPDEAAQIMTKWQPTEGLDFYKLAVRALIPLVDVPQYKVGMIDPVRWAQLMGASYNTETPGYSMQFLQGN
jgi:ABC-type nitrate/sulfonate/bicarbonate transport system substrate-binding protein